VKLLDQAIFFIEFVLHHKQAKHLLVAAHDHNWFQYHSLDVIGFLLAYVASATLLVAKCCVFIFQKKMVRQERRKNETR
jgi:glucuronosyltransferase